MLDLQKLDIQMLDLRKLDLRKLTKFCKVQKKHLYKCHLPLNDVEIPGSSLLQMGFLSKYSDILLLYPINHCTCFW